MSAEADPTVAPVSAAGGDPACWAHEICAECGAITSEGHRDGCDAAAIAPPAASTTGEDPERAR